MVGLRINGSLDVCKGFPFIWGGLGGAYADFIPARNGRAQELSMDLRKHVAPRALLDLPDGPFRVLRDQRVGVQRRIAQRP